MLDRFRVAWPTITITINLLDIALPATSSCTPKRVVTEGFEQCRKGEILKIYIPGITHRGSLFLSPASSCTGPRKPIEDKRKNLMRIW